MTRVFLEGLSGYSCAAPLGTLRLVALRSSGTLFHCTMLVVSLHMYPESLDYVDISKSTQLM